MMSSPNFYCILDHMKKGVFILIIVFVCIGILHFITMRLMNLEAVKKMKYIQFFWYFYGVIFCASGLVNLVEKEKFNVIFLFQFVLGLTVIFLNFLNKLNQQK